MSDDHFSSDERCSRPEPSKAVDAKHCALIVLGRKLSERGYRFTAVSPKTHQIVADRADKPRSLRSIFGWNRPFSLDDVERDIVEALERAGALEHRDGYYRSAVRFATIDDLIFA